MSPSRKQAHPGIRSGLLAIAILSGILTLLSAAPAFAFTSAPHTEMTVDAAGAEGFSPDATSLMGVENTFMDFYQWVGASANPYSGQGTSLGGRLLIGNLGTENWPMSVVAAASRSHFDNNPVGAAEGLRTDGLMETLGTTAGVTAEWERLQRSTWTLLQEARSENNPRKADSVLGASLHEVQDFYAHTNWVEPVTGKGAEGPGWREHNYGSYPTWFDVPAIEREKFTIYGDSTPGHSRTHGYWDSGNNENVYTSMNKDAPPRPYYLEASITAYFATRQWIEAARSWVGDAAFWRRMQHFDAKGAEGRELKEERAGLFRIMLYSGRWEGQGEPIGGPSGDYGAAGNLFELRAAVKHYFDDIPKTVFRKEFEGLIVRLAKRNAPGKLMPVPSSQQLQKEMAVVVLRITKMESQGLFGLGDPWPDQADMYAEMAIDEQQYRSDVIHGENSFSFRNPYEPFTKYKVLSRNTIEREPVESIEVQVTTADSRGAGTDDDVSLWLGENLVFPLDKRGEDDFERGKHATYSVPIDEAVRDGLRVGDIDRLWLSKSEDGTFGGAWELGGVKLYINGHKVYENTEINKWLQDNRRMWTARNFVRRNPRGPKIPIWLQLKDDDFTGGTFPDPNPYDPFSGEDDQGDVNPYDNRDSISYGYVLGQKVERSSQGGNRLGGRLGYGGDDASVTFTLETLFPELIGEAGTVTREISPPAPPDLVITSMAEHSVTVKNIGGSAAGPFRVRSTSENGEDTQIFTGLAAGASEKRRLEGIPTCEFIESEVDDLQQVQESNESNNVANTQGIVEIC